jgi:hypothetical protein
MKKINIDDLDHRERLLIEKSIDYEIIFELVRRLSENMGKFEMINGLRPWARMSGQALCINLQKVFGIEGSDIERIAEVSQLMELLTGCPFSPSQMIQLSDERIISAGHLDCLNRGAPVEFCIIFHETILNGICEAINPEYKCRFTQMITNGDPICSYVIEKKKK